LTNQTIGLIHVLCDWLNTKNSDIHYRNYHCKNEIILFILGFLKNECHIEERNCIALSLAEKEKSMALEMYIP